MKAGTSPAPSAWLLPTDHDAFALSRLRQRSQDNIIEMVQAELTPHVLASTLIPGCLEKGKDITSGGALYNWTPPFGVGLATAADSLCAVKKLVFDERVLSLQGLNQTLDNLLSLCQPQATVLLLGPSTPLSPVLYRFGIDFLSGSVVTDINSVLAAIKQGANFRQVHRAGVRLVTMSRDK